MAYEKLKVSTDDKIMTIALSDPATMNAAGVEMAGELHAALRRASAPGANVRAIVLTGEGRGFCSGANLQQTGPSNRAAEPGDRLNAGGSLATVYNPLVTFMREMPIPLVTAINGPAAGVGCSLALLGDLVVASETAYFLQAFRRIGLIPDGGSTYVLPRLIGKARAMEMALLGERMPAAKALEWGLIKRRRSRRRADADRPGAGRRAGPRPGVARLDAPDHLVVVRQQLARTAPPRGGGPGHRRQDRGLRRAIRN